MKQFFVEMFLYGGVVVPAFDALSLKIKAVKVHEYVRTVL